MSTYLKSGLIPNNKTTPILIPITRADRFYADMQSLFQCLGKDVQLRGGNSPAENRDKSVPHITNAPLAVHLLEGLLLQMQQQPTGSAVGPATLALQELAQQIRHNPQRDWNFSEEAVRLSISLNHFRRIFPQCIGIPPDRYLRECRLDYAARLLRESEDLVAEIAQQVGIPDLHHFTKLFKAHHNITPGMYRRSYRV